MPITFSEKIIFSKKSERIADTLMHLDQNDFENTVLLFKVLAYALQDNEILIQDLDESIFENPEILKEKFFLLLQHALTVATSATSVPVQKITARANEYSPAQLSKYFGVSVVTIHNWLKQGRFIGIKHAGDNKHNKIPDNLYFTTSAGGKLLISDVVEMWNRQQAESDASKRNETEYEYYTRAVAEYEQKYNGEFERTLGAKEYLSPEEQTDAEIWRHLLRRQMCESRDSKE